jgi:beta-fructofuranosidase
MPLRLPDKWVWDFWLARDAQHHHVFYLQAPRSLRRSELRHHNASIGHAISSDLRRWRVLPDALHPGPPGSWDDLATWTGSVIEQDGRWHMLYTGINRSEGGLIQRIGLAVSEDLTHWTKHPANPVLEADGRWYELLDPTRWRDQSWRDPYLFVDPIEGDFRVLISARSREGAPDGAGVLAHARSPDLVQWEVFPALTPHGEFAQVECPQLILLEHRYLILFSCLGEDHSAARRQRLGNGGVTGTYVFSAQELEGPYVASAAPIAEANGLGPLYAGKLVESDSPSRAFMAFRGAGDRGFVGELTDPLPLLIHDDGRLSLAVDGAVHQPLGVQ